LYNVQCTSPPDAIYANMKSAGSGRDLTAELNGRAHFGPLWLGAALAVLAGKIERWKIWPSMAGL